MIVLMNHKLSAIDKQGFVVNDNIIISIPNAILGRPYT